MKLGIILIVHTRRPSNPKGTAMIYLWQRARGECAATANRGLWNGSRMGQMRVSVIQSISDCLGISDCLNSRILLRCITGNRECVFPIHIKSLSLSPVPLALSHFLSLFSHSFGSFSLYIRALNSKSGLTSNDCHTCGVVGGRSAAPRSTARHAISSTTTLPPLPPHLPLPPPLRRPR